MADEWPQETLAERRNRLLRALDDTGITEWTPQQRKKLVETVDDFISRESARAAREAQRRDFDRRLDLRLKVFMAMVAVLAVGASLLGGFLASHTTPSVVVQPPSTPSPSATPTRTP